MGYEVKKNVSSIDLLRNLGSVDFLVLLSRFAIFFQEVISTFVYYLLKKNCKSAKIIQKINEP